MTTKKSKKAAGDSVTMTRAELDAALAKAGEAGRASNVARPTGAIGEEITSRPYRTITDKKGEIVCRPPTEGGPIAIDGQHPDDFYAVNDDGHATKNAG